MTILKNCEIWWPALMQKYPDKSFDPKKPVWKVDLRTTSSKQKEEWTELGLNPKLIVGAAGKENEGEPILVDGKKQWKVTLRKKAYISEKEAEKDVKDQKKPVAPEVFDGKLNEIDPSSIGNGSIAHVKIFQYPYVAKGVEKTGSVLMGLQLVKHIVRKASNKKGEDFDEIETETILPEVEEGEEPAF